MCVVQQGGQGQIAAGSSAPNQAQLQISSDEAGEQTDQAQAMQLDGS